MKTRCRLQVIGWPFNRKEVLVLQVLKRFPDGPGDSNGLPTSLAGEYWIDAKVEDCFEGLDSPLEGR